MILLRIIANALVMATELALVAGAAWLAYHYPPLFAVVTGLLALVLGLRLEFARLAHELPFYFDGEVPLAGLLARFVATFEAVLKGLLAGLVALLTFSGTDQNRLLWEAVLFAGSVYTGAWVIAHLGLRYRMRPARWGYFRLAPPLGLLFSIGVAGLVAAQLLKAPGITDVLQKGLLETAARPSVAQASELLFLVKMWFDSVVVGLLSTVVGPVWAPVIGTVLSVNVLAGFVIAIYALLVAEIGLALERQIVPAS